MFSCKRLFQASVAFLKEAAQPKPMSLLGTHSRQRYQYRPSLEPLEERCLLSTDMVVQWNEIAVQAAVNDYSLAPGYQIGPTRLGRAMAIVQAAVYDSVNSIDPQYTP